jgi:hypothetical protein
VNGIGLESGNAENCNGRTIPWLQDVTGTDVWTSWQVNYRDVVILDPDNVTVGVYNLSAQDLGVPANYEALRNLLVQAATTP